MTSSHQLLAYKGAVHNFKFHGPTMFSEIFRMACEYAAYESSQDKQKYLILLMLTDGDISDMQATKDEIVKACDLPLSILIIGVGNDEFSQMKM
jgi:Mg-chelatase subunit ChlD